MRPYTPTNEISSLIGWANKVDCLSLSRKYLKAFRVSNEENTPGENASTARATSLASLLEIEANLTRTLDEESFEHGVGRRQPSEEFVHLYNEIASRRDEIRRHVYARAVKTLHSILDEITYPSPDASQFILNFLDNDKSKRKKKNTLSDSNICLLVRAIQQVSSPASLMNEFIKPIVRRVRHHFILSGDETIPQDKVDKLPHLILAYLRHLLTHTAPVIGILDDEAYFYAQINALVQHVLFQRGYFERMSNPPPSSLSSSSSKVKSNTVSLTVLVQDIMKYDAFIQECVGGINTFQEKKIPSLTEKLICHNSNLFQWWISAQHNHATHALLTSITTSSDRDDKSNAVHSSVHRSVHSSAHHGASTIKRITETFQSFLYSQKVKASLLQQPSSRSVYVEKVIKPTCMFYLKKQHERATALRGQMDGTTIYVLSSILNQWIVLIDSMAQASLKLTYSEGSADDDNGNNDDKNPDPPGDMHVHMPELQVMGEDFQNMSRAMIEECTNSYITLLMERSTFASFLMTASHTLSHGPNDDEIVFGLEDVHLILQALSTPTGTGLLMGQRRVRDELLHNVRRFLEKQFLEILLDDSLTMRIDGCQSFIGIIGGLMDSTVMEDDNSHDYGDESIEVESAASTTASHRRNIPDGKLNDLCRFLEVSMIDSMRGALFSLMDKDEDDDVIDYEEVEMDGTIFEEVENMVRSKGFKHMTVRECISLLNRTSK